MLSILLTHHSSLRIYLIWDYWQNNQLENRPWRAFSESFMKTKATRWTEKCKTMIILQQSSYQVKLKQKAATFWQYSQRLSELEGRQWTEMKHLLLSSEARQTNTNKLYEGVVSLWMRSWKKCAPVCRNICICVSVFYSSITMTTIIVLFFSATPPQVSNFNSLTVNNNDTSVIYAVFICLSFSSPCVSSYLIFAWRHGFTSLLYL